VTNVKPSGRVSFCTNPERRKSQVTRSGDWNVVLSSGSVVEDADDQ
jgi:hypothetical protein